MATGRILVVEDDTATQISTRAHPAVSITPPAVDGDEATGAAS